jgi:hypothetical protein
MRRELIPKHAIGPLRIAAKSGFLTKRIWNEFFASGNRFWRFRRWQALVGTGFFNSVPDYGFVESAVTLSDKGKAIADSLGMNPVYSPPAKNLWHDEELIRLALFLERQGWITNWMTEQELKVSGESVKLFRDEVRAAKIPDLIIEWNTSPKKILWAIELERTRKEFSRYYEMVGAYKGISRIESVLIIVAAKSIEANIKKAQGRMAYPQAERPMFFASMNEVIEDPISCELRQGPNRMALGKFAKALTGKEATEPALEAKTLGNKTGNNVSSESKAA